MSTQEEKQDQTSLGTLAVAIVVLVGMALLPAVIGWSKLF